MSPKKQIEWLEQGIERREELISRLEQIIQLHHQSFSEMRILHQRFVALHEEGQEPEELTAMIIPLQAEDIIQQLLLTLMQEMQSEQILLSTWLEAAQQGENWWECGGCESKPPPFSSGQLDAQDCEWFGEDEKPLE